MNKTKHSPGPWSYDGQDAHGDCVVNDKNQRVATVHCRYDFEGKRSIDKSPASRRNRPPHGHCPRINRSLPTRPGLSGAR